VGNVPISADGVAEVDLSAAARAITSSQLQQLSAQVVWTLRQVSSVTAVRLLANGVPLTAAGVASLQPVDGLPQFDPAPAPAVRGALVAHDGSVDGVGITVPAALRSRGLSNPAESADGRVVAAVRGAGASARLLLGKPDGRLRTQSLPGAVTALAFAPDDRLVVATAAGRLYAVAPRESPVPIGLPASLDGVAVHDVAMSPDGTRLALVVGTPGATSLVVATVAGWAAAPDLTEQQTLLPGSAAVAGVAWPSAGQLVTTVAIRHRRVVVAVGTDGYQANQLTESGLPADVDHVAASPGQPTLASSPTGTWALGSGRWRQVSTATGASYAGG
jgi:hypothetical protein